MPYSTSTELTAYATARGITLTGDLDVLLIKANDYIESLDFQGERLVSDQENKWPRAYVYIDDVLISSTVVPEGIKRAEMQTAIEIMLSNDPLANVDRATKTETLGDMSITYMDSATLTTRLTKVKAILKPYLSGGMGNLVRG